MNNKLDQIEKLFTRVVYAIENEQDECKSLFKIYYDLIIALSEASALHFNTLFARISFITTRYPVSNVWRYLLQIPRREMQSREMSEVELLPILKASIQLLLNLCREEFEGASALPEPPLPNLPNRRRAGKFKKKFARVIAIEWNQAAGQLTILDEEEPDDSRILQYNVAGINDLFSETLELALNEIGLPLTLGLTDIECTEEEHYVPSYIVIMPDMLLDVTAITQVISDGADPLAVNVIDIYLPKSSSDAIILGNVANFFLDEMIRDTDKPFLDIFKASFKIYPMEFIGMDDIHLKNIFEKMSAHYENIQRVMEERFPKLGIDRKHCVIEPSYYSPQFGIKGRLDLYYENEEEQVASIIELKSSKPFMPNSYGLSSANYHQTLLYDLLIRSTHGAGYKRSNYILYSGEANETLRYAVSVEAIQKETIQHRNQLAILQFRLMQLDKEKARDVFAEVDSKRYPFIKGYVKRNMEEWQKVYTALSPGEKQYFKSFTAFVTREHTLARIGSDQGDGTGGLAGLWLDTIQEKEERYHILQKLELAEIDQDVHQTKITFTRTAQTNPLANFRAGDIAVMYPDSDETLIDPTKYQLHRASIIAIDAEKIIIRLRNMQIHTGQIEKYKLWNLERDMLDSGFRGLYQSLWNLMKADQLTRQTILGLIPPMILSPKSDIPCPEILSEKQREIYLNGINAGDLYLLWGPPGTGKTSVLLKSWAWYFFHQTNQRIVLLAYTNKAVDEICEALESSEAAISDQYIRIGSSAATGEKYRHKLFDQVIEPMTTREEIKERLEKTQIFVATISSLHGKSGLFDLLSFDVAIMDEASQLLEPAVVGLLTKFKKTILIGDHMQLPAVSVQPDNLSLIDPAATWGKRIGITDMRMSYFERMYRLYKARGWHHLIGILHEQGRMHTDIMAVVNRQVYDGFLYTIDPVRQHQPLSAVIKNDQSVLFQHRLIYIPSTSELTESYLKTNQDEAVKVITLVKAWLEKIEKEKLDWTIGVITPFRAQIAAITYLAHQQNLDMEKVTIDTVERYQGGARDIIIMSCAVNIQQTMKKISSLNTEGIDRKLNVAVSRARQQFILIGNEEILSKEQGYKALMDMSRLYDMALLV